jgi:hypothetical protein
MAVVLKDSRVLICGADTNCELYFPKTKKFRETSHTHGNNPRNPILLPDGTVLISMGGVSYDNPQACFELFDPETETFRMLHSSRCALLMKPRRRVYAVRTICVVRKSWNALPCITTLAEETQKAR